MMMNFIPADDAAAPPKCHSIHLMGTGSVLPAEHGDDEACMLSWMLHHVLLGTKNYIMC